MKLDISIAKFNTAPKLQLTQAVFDQMIQAVYNIKPVCHVDVDEWIKLKVTTEGLNFRGEQISRGIPHIRIANPNEMVAKCLENAMHLMREIPTIRFLLVENKDGVFHSVEFDSYPVLNPLINYLIIMSKIAQPVDCNFRRISCYIYDVIECCRDNTTLFEVLRARKG